MLPGRVCFDLGSYSREVNGLLIGSEFLQELLRTPSLSTVLVTSSTLVAPVTLLTLTRLTG